MGGQVWLTTATVEGHDFFAIGVDAETGKIRFNEKVFHSDNPEPLGNGASMNCYATPSPVIEPGRVYVHFGSFGTACLDTSTGKVLWKRDDLPCRHYRGPSSSLVVFENLLILTMDGADLQYHVALDKQTGKTVWKTDRSVAWNDENVPGQMARDGDLRKAHSTPLIVTAAGKPLMLSAGAKAAYGYDPRTGRELWKVQYDDWSTAPRPLFDRGLAFFVTGLAMRELWAVKTDGQGDVTDTGVVWKFKNARRQIRLAAARGRPDLHGGRGELRHLPRSRHRASSSGRSGSAASTRPRRSTPMGGCISSASKARPPSSNPAAPSRSWRPTPSPTASWRRRRSPAKRSSCARDAPLPD